ncbi:DUF2577 family protein [Heyndrickxia sp. FSL W8-0496]|uniref:DUF2577 family protein n=1 Tax=Heyndrickxia sp. FSL W8-0496 TaxID=2954702 RepID=UPI0030F51F36
MGTKMAKLFKDRDNQIPSSITTGKVISPPPNAKIRLNDVVILYNNNLVWSAHMLEEYERELELKGEIKFTDSDCGSTSDGATVTTLNVDTTFEAKDVKMTTKDTVKEGDEVILMPTTDDQLYFVLCKAVRFE